MGFLLIYICLDYKVFLPHLLYFILIPPTQNDLAMVKTFLPDQAGGFLMGKRNLCARDGFWDGLWLDSGS